jgi:hypothetical protein
MTDAKVIELNKKMERWKNGKLEEWKNGVLE